MFTVCFYQDSRHAEPLVWFRRKIGIGYLSYRNDGITELRINGFERTGELLRQLRPFIKFKKLQVSKILEILRLLKKTRFERLQRKTRLKIARLIHEMRKAQYQSGWKKKAKSYAELKRILGF